MAKIVGRMDKYVLRSRCNTKQHGWNLQASYLTKCFTCDKVLDYTEIGAISLTPYEDKHLVKPYCDSKCKKRGEYATS